ncbi:MAG TPA: condensation domain-containing protein, partial [Chitinophagaceae bacterium]|nr:condensation domain-containing protein [Chitinophagaceae bacterium]
KNGEQPSLPDKTATIAQWLQNMPSYNHNEEQYWQVAEQTAFTLPQSRHVTDWKYADLGIATAKLDADNTRFLLREAHHVYHTDVSVLLNTALALSLTEWTGNEQLVVWQENHGRHLPLPDVTRTTGWFTAMYPVLLHVHDDALGNQVKNIKEQLKSLPGHGLGYGIRTCWGDEHNATRIEIPSVRFNYLGQFDSEFDNDLFSFCEEQPGLGTDPANTMTAKLELNAMITGGRLKLDVYYNRRAHEETTIVQFISSFLRRLETILDHIRNEREIHFTPSDFDAVKLDQAELDALFS